MNPDDRDLRGRFADLRADESHRAPALAHVLARQRQPRRAAWAPLATAAAIVLAATFVLGGYAHRRDELRRAEAAVAGWQSLAVDTWDAPTAFLLSVPASDILDSMPELGSSSTTGSVGEGASTRPAPSADSSRRSRS